MKKEWPRNKKNNFLKKTMRNIINSMMEFAEKKMKKYSNFIIPTEEILEAEIQKRDALLVIF